MHKSVGAIVKDKDKILMIKRAIRPFGWSCPSGHIDEGETPEQAVVREFKEEVNLDIKNPKLLIHEFLDWNECSKGIKGHDWYVFEALEWQGDIKRDKRETDDVSWVKIEDLKNLDLEPAWEYWFKKLNLLN